MNFYIKCTYHIQSLDSDRKVKFGTLISKYKKLYERAIFGDMMMHNVLPMEAVLRIGYLHLRFIFTFLFLQRVLPKGNVHMNVFQIYCRSMNLFVRYYYVKKFFVCIHLS